MRTVIMTGAAGFLGSHLLAALANDTGVRAVPLTRREADLCDGQQVLRAFQRVSAEPESVEVVHLAAAMHPAHAEAPNYSIYDLNSTISSNVLNASMSCGFRRVLAIGSLTMFDGERNGPFAETEALSGWPPHESLGYALSKREMVWTARLLRGSGHSLLTLAIPNLVDEQLAGSPVLNNIMATLKEAKASGKRHAVLRADPKAGREFMFVMEATEAVKKALSLSDWPDVLNVPGGGPVRFGDFGAAYAQMIGFSGDLIWELSANGTLRFLDGKQWVDRFPDWSPRAIMPLSCGAE